MYLKLRTLSLICANCYIVTKNKQKMTNYKKSRPLWVITKNI